MKSPKEFAQQFNDSQYPFRLPKQDIQSFKDNRCVVVYGASDDIVKCEGFVGDEAGAYDGGIAYLSSKGFLPIDESGNLSDSIETIEEARKIVQDFDSAIKIEAFWASSEYSWQYKIHNSDVEYAEFDILDDDEKYCRAIVLRMPQ